MTEQPIKISVDVAGIGTVHVGETDVSEFVTAIDVAIRPNTTTKVRIEFTCDVDISLECADVVDAVHGRTRIIGRKSPVK